jgi:hypothetical protein
LYDQDEANANERLTKRFRSLSQRSRGGAPFSSATLPRLFFLPRPLIPSATIKAPAGALLVHPTPLLEMKRHVGLNALVAYGSNPLFWHWARARTAFAAGNSPVDVIQIQFV